MKNLLYTLIFTLICATGVAQIGYKPMNGYYEFNGNLRMSDTLFVKTTAISVVGNATKLSLDTTGSAASGYYKIIASSEGEGTLKGSGVAGGVAVFGAEDSVYSPPQFNLDTATSSLILKSAVDNTKIHLQQADTITTLTSQSLDFSVGGDLLNQSIEFKTGGTGGGIALKVDSMSTRLLLDPTENLFLNGADTNMSIRLDSGYVGIRTGSPLYPLDIDARSDVAIGIRKPLIIAGSNTATFTNAPAAGDPIFYLRIDFISSGGSIVKGVIPILPIP